MPHGKPFFLLNSYSAPGNGIDRTCKPICLSEQSAFFFAYKGLIPLVEAVLLLLSTTYPTMMPTCSICIDSLKEPVALPCGHVFCSECISRAVNTIIPTCIVQPCPTCRSLYSIAHVDPELIPTSMRSHVSPSIRRLYLDESTPDTNSPFPSSSSSSSLSLSSSSSSTSRQFSQELVSECGRLSAENKTLRMNCGVWQKRAEVHSAATMGLLNLARMAKAYNAQLKLEKEKLQRECMLLKRKLELEESFMLSDSVFASSSPKAATDVSDIHSSLLLSLTDGTPSTLRTTLSPTPNSKRSRTESRGIPADRDLPPSLKRRKTGSHSIDLDSQNEQTSVPRRPLPSRRRREVVS
ncbi:hypothetical protein D9757_007663 [Collybiopsis confluens]|uniref:RING-type E3 ubiquitin transferase n=1 Tax=Collybiopsis confluens TaxID=2823264 RepID=A0A8H5M3E8_9AGAR|nr:hypothetical protein D9757_007663 [Collybiopsis confluens]